jgi:hypothetical protein
VYESPDVGVGESSAGSSGCILGRDIGSFSLFPTSSTLVGDAYLLSTSGGLLRLRLFELDGDDPVTDLREVAGEFDDLEKCSFLVTCDRIGRVIGPSSLGLRGGGDVYAGFLDSEVEYADRLPYVGLCVPAFGDENVSSFSFPESVCSE